jgi:type IV secretory pathway TrbF-like protein
MFAREQRGATFLGMVIIAAILGCAVYAGIRLIPLYFEYMAIARAMEQTAKEEKGSPTSPQEIRNALDRRWTIEDIKSIDPKEIEVKKNGNGYTMHAAYRAETPFVANVSLVVDFDKTVDVVTTE